MQTTKKKEINPSNKKIVVTPFARLWLVLCIAIVLVPNHITGQYHSLLALENKNHLEIPFTYRQGFILIDVHFQYLFPLTFIFDTGAQNTILFDRNITDLINTEYSREIKIYGADYSNELTALIARNMNIATREQNNGVDMDVLVLKDDIVKLGEIVGKEIHGILGANFFKGLIVEINYRKQKVVLHNPEKFNYKKVDKFNAVPLVVKNHKPYIQATAFINDSRYDSLYYLMDTGASLSFLMHADSDTSRMIPENSIPGSLGKGLGGDIEGHIGLIDSLSICANIVFKRPLSYFQAVDSFENGELFRDGIIGNTLLERFHIYIDYFRSMVYLKPTKYFNKAFYYDKSGMTVVASGKNFKTFIVSRVRTGSPAEEAGIRKGDVLLKVGWRSKFFLDLPKITDILSGDAEKVIGLKIRRDKEILRKKIILRDAFN